MMGHLGFSYVGAIYLIGLFIPNLFWTRYQPDGYSAVGESRPLRLLERIGEIFVTCFSVIFSDFNLRFDSLWSLWLLPSVLCMILYEVYWLRYFHSSKKMTDFYCSLFGIPVAGATLPVAAFFLLGIYGRNIWMLIAVFILGIGHIGIHLEHQKRLQ